MLPLQTASRRELCKALGAAFSRCENITLQVPACTITNTQSKPSKQNASEQLNSEHARDLIWISTCLHDFQTLAEKVAFPLALTLFGDTSYLQRIFQTIPDTLNTSLAESSKLVSNRNQKCVKRGTYAKKEITQKAFNLCLQPHW